MVLEQLGKALHGALQKITRAAHVDERAVKELVREIQRALLQADVNVELVLDLTKRIEKRALEEKLPPGMSRKEHVIKIVYEELSAFLGKPAPLQLEAGRSKVLLMVGLQGSGKTTSVAKLAAYFKKRGYKPAIVCADTYRPGAYEQLRQLGQQIGVEVFGDPESTDPIVLAKEGVRRFKKERSELIIVDTAGRHRREEALMQEMQEIARAVEPDEIMLVIDGTIGQQAKEQASAFKQATPIGSILVTKLDGTAKGGGALSAVAATGAPIKFIGVGEHIEDLEPFVPEKFVARLLGMGDLETLLQKIEEVTKEEKLKPADVKAMMAGKITLRDVYEQLEAMSKMGPLRKIMQMIPGVGVSLPEEQMRVGEEKLKKFKYIMQSMTPQELEDPKILNASRIRRVARGSGTTETEVRELLKQYELMKRFLKAFAKGRGPRMGQLGKLFRSGYGPGEKGPGKGS
ncbi:MAG: signal recognition particle protein Srp54 [Candidatus Hadarchaeum sp.]|uniref:signal recognition particle protein Srp54 n=1 Tax=Candidatus Hadarchaeum sp. TaxID=2883567 RepID=UPI003D12E672